LPFWESCRRAYSIFLPFSYHHNWVWWYHSAHERSKNPRCVETQRIGGGWRLCLPEVAGVATMMQGAPMKNFLRITVDPAQMGGVPCVRHVRIPVATVLRLLAGGLTEREILSEYPDLQAEDIRECLRFAAASAMEREMPLPYSA
jgi:uncharacterized protein (DUF433 family)